MSDVKAMQAKWKKVLCHILDSLGGLITHTQLFTSNLPAAKRLCIYVLWLSMAQSPYPASVH